jgi:putative protein kinase ArgK-like GTPase of G3E family
MVEDQPSPAVEKNQASEPSGIDSLADKIRSLEQWYAADFERRVADLTELLKAQITDELRVQFSAELEQRTQRIRKEYEERLYITLGEWPAQEAALRKEIEELKRLVPSGDLPAEIAAIEAALSRSASGDKDGFDRQATNPAMLGRMLQEQIEEIEMKAYLRGLKFRTA